MNFAIFDDSIKKLGPFFAGSVKAAVDNNLLSINNRDSKIINKTRMSQVCAISKAQKIKKIEGGTLERHKNVRERVAQCRKKSKGGPFSPVRFCRLRLKIKKLKGVSLWNNLVAFPWYLVSS